MTHLARAIALSMALVILAASSAARAAEEPKPPTNVVLIVCDDLGFGDLACYGNEKFHTPNLDRVAQEGARLTGFTSCCPEGAGPRVALQTGRYPFRTKLIDTPRPEKGFDELGLQTEELTLGEAFQQAGYSTACFGKWELGHHAPYMPTQNGYDQYFGLLYSNDLHPVKLFKNDQLHLSVVFQPKLTSQYTFAASAFIEENKDRPFFLYLAHSMPHKPLAPGDNFFNATGAGLYADVIAELDASVGNILAKLAELKIDDRTLLVFTSDDGPWFGGSTGGLRGMYGQTWEGGLRVPLLARWPGKIEPAHENAEPCTMADLYPTLLAAANIPVPKDRAIDGRDITPLLTSDAKSPHKAIFSFVGPYVATVRSGKWKLHTPMSGPRPIQVMSPYDRYVDPHGPNGLTILAPRDQPHPSNFPGIATGFSDDGFALVNLDEDPSEQINVLSKNAGVVADLQGEAEKMQAEVAKVLGPLPDLPQPAKPNAAPQGQDSASAPASKPAEKR